MDDFLFCINCGKKIPHEARFCIHCGSKVPEPKTPIEVEDTAPITENEVEVNNNTNNSNTSRKNTNVSSKLIKKRTQISKAKTNNPSTDDINDTIIETDDDIAIPLVLVDGKKEEVFEMKRRELVTSKKMEGRNIDEYDYYYENVDPIDKGNEYNPFKKNRKTIMIGILTTIAFFAVGIGVILYVLKDF